MSFREYLDSLKDKRVAVIGAGISNTPLIEALLSSGIDTTICDRQNRVEMGEKADGFEELGGKLRLGEDYLKNLDADVIFRTPGLMPWNDALREAVSRGALLTSEMEVFFELCPCKIIAVTGSDGKTTTTTIISEMLKKEGKNVHLGGNIGNPLLCEADHMEKDDIVVLELSSFQLISMKKSPDIAVITNISPNHLDVHRDYEEYIEAKKCIFINQSNSGRVVLNYDNDITRSFANTALGDVLFFSRFEKAIDGFYVDDGVIYESIDNNSDALMSCGDVLLPGVHNIENYMAAFAAVRGLVEYETMIEIARTFGGVPHRIELVRQLRGVRYYNDSIASSPSRTIAGLRAFNQKVILIAGGKDKGIEFEELGKEIIKHVKTLVLTGLTAETIKNAIIDSSEFIDTPTIIMKEDFDEAVQAASLAASDGDVVILSPACTSFDRFKNFEERGDTFKNIVKGLI
ncbi:MAG: UDP-N-acetylmuramoyl-L-alanine--D-glutamate ligase [Oscillospiraceae bacterium]|nr:UDP-N-acetylmuramoyl-L-alanine--D-glutamate ligase [Oscillospiraceae bacterium]